MKVRLRGKLASPAGSWPAGAVVDLPREEAAWLLKSGQASPVEGEVEAAPETAVERQVEVIKRKGKGA